MPDIQLKTNHTKIDITDNIKEQAHHSTINAIPRVVKKQPSKLYSFRFIFISAIVFLLICIFTFWAFTVCQITVTSEVGATPDYSHINDNFLLSLFAKVDCDLENIDTSKIGVSNVPIKLFGFISLNSTLVLSDTTPPDLVVQDVKKIINSPVYIQDFVVSCTDQLPVTYNLKGFYASTEQGVYNLTICATDTVGNKTEKKVTLSIVTDITPPTLSGPSDLYYTIGDKKPNYLGEITAHDDTYGDVPINVDSSKVNLKKEGVYPIVYSATDMSGNTAKKTVNMHVKYPTSVKLNVKNILQMPSLPNGCEVVSLTIALRYAGYDIDALSLYNFYMPKSPLNKGDPWTTYVGDARGNGFGCYAPCVVETGNSYLSDHDSELSVYNVSGKNINDYKYYLCNGKPVILWGLINMNGNGMVGWSAKINGKSVKWHSYSHCLVLIGYTEDTYIFCDPLRGIVEYNQSSVEKSFNINYKQACVIE